MSTTSDRQEVSTDFSPLIPVSSLLKRRASPSFDCMDDERKRMKKSNDDSQNISSRDDEVKFADLLADDMQCGCCSELVYKPVIVMPCQHFFCGSCCMLWIRNGGTNCPACRTIVTVAMPFRAMQPMLDSLLRIFPHKTRAEGERQQADEVYKSGNPIRFPPPKEASPAPELDMGADYVQPCPHCLANNPYDWRCPQPIPDPAGDPDNAWHVDDGIPPGHAHCGNCENLLALQAPTTSKCDFCQVLFCGIGVQDRCIATPISSQHPHNLSTHEDLIQSRDIYECFAGNTVEVEILLEYVEKRKVTPTHIYREIIQYMQDQPGGFRPLVELDLFKDIHPIPPAGEVALDAPRNKVCRSCAAEILLWGIRDWWIRERRKGFMEEKIINRPNCADGNACLRQKLDHGHAREYNHIFSETEPQSEESNGTAAPSETNMSPASNSSSTLTPLLNADNDEGSNQPLPSSAGDEMTNT